MVMDGRPWTNECCMCAGRTHAGVGRSERVERRKADFGPVVSSPRGGFGGFWGGCGRPIARTKIGSAARGEGGRSVLGAQTGASGGTSGPNWGHNRAELGAQPAGGWWVRWVSGGCFRPNAGVEVAPGREPDWVVRGGTNRPGCGHIRPPRGGLGGFQGFVLACWRAKERPEDALCPGRLRLWWGQKRNVPPLLKNVPPNVPPSCADGGGWVWTGPDS